MAEQIISPGVFTNEYDQSYLPSAIGNIGAAIIGPTSRGQGFIPTIVTSYADFTSKFGGSNDDTYVPYAVKAYLENTGTMTIVRVLGLTGYKIVNVPILVAADVAMTGSAVQVAALLHPTYRTNTSTGEGLKASYVTSSKAGFSVASGSPYYPADNFNMILSGSAFATSTTTNNISLDPLNANFIGKAFGTSPKVGYKPTVESANSAMAYRYLTFGNNLTKVMSGSTEKLVAMDVSTTLDLSGSDVYRSAKTPWISSQLVNGQTYPLFQVATQAQGQDLNSAYKIGILNIKKAGEVPGTNYGSFTLVVRSINDTDKAPNVLETYSDLNLDPESPNFITRVIGDKYPTYNSTYKKIVWTGDYDNKSKYIYIVLDDNVKMGTLSSDLVPFGFNAVSQPIVCPIVKGIQSTLPTASLVTAQQYNGSYNSKVYFGYNFDFDNTDNANYLLPIADNATTGSNINFVLDNYFTDVASSVGVISLSSSLAPITSRKFIVPFQDGFDGFDPSKLKAMGSDISATNTMGMNCGTTSADGYVAYKQAIDLLSNADQYDINMLVTPGLIDFYHPGIISYAVDMCESRGDCFYIFDATKLESFSVEDATNQTANYDSSYAATYYPWLKIFDSERNKYLWVPATVSVAGAISYNDKVGYEWYAPAGLNRGSLTTTRDVFNVLSKPEIDILYAGRVNPIATFPGEGLAVWGQKTLQAKPSALDRVNVRRLLINLKKFVASSSKYLVFEANTSATRNKFLGMVNPYMESVQQKSGLYSFKIIMDETNNDSAVIDRNMLYGQVFIQPTKTAEFVLIDFNIQPTGASFPE